MSALKPTPFFKFARKGTLEKSYFEKNYFEKIEFF